MMIDERFPLEQKIMEAWHIVDDLKLLYKSCEGMNEDQIMSALHGLQIFAEMRFESLWDTFEKYNSDRELDTKKDEDTIYLFDPDTGYTMNVSTDFVLNESP